MSINLGCCATVYFFLIIKFLFQRLVEAFNGPKMMCLLEHIRSPFQFQKLFRIKLPTFFKIKEILYVSDPNTAGWMPEIELLLFLFWLSGGLSYKKVEKLLDIPETLLQDMFQRVFDRFLKHVCEIIHFPKKNYEYLSKGFMQLTGSRIFGLTVGCLDAFHVYIAFPSQKDDLQYLNDNDEFSVQVQAVCDYRGAFMDIAVGFPGSMLKPHVLQCTPLYLGRFLPPPGFVLLSGRGYPCLQEPICIIPPFTDAKNREEVSFNKRHEVVHSVLKKSVGQMFDRWRRIFSKPIMYPLSDITNIIIACAMIHNIGLEMDDVWPKKTAVDFSINQEHLSLVEGQTSGDITQRGIAQHSVPQEILSKPLELPSISSEDEEI